MTVINQRLINLLNTLPVKVNLNVSIDGPKHIHNYIRHGCDLDQIINNLNHLAKNYKFQFGINSTISALNVGYIPEMLDTINSIGLPFTHLMSSPVLESHLHAGVLPDEIKALYTIKLKSADCKNATQQELVDTALKLLQEDKQEHWPQFVKFISAFDSATNTNLKSVYPELALL
jgi:sulfatase maturation enzyme AslB (radical SAM superfamily)